MDDAAAERQSINVERFDADLAHLCAFEAGSPEWPHDETPQSLAARVRAHLLDAVPPCLALARNAVYARVYVCVQLAQPGARVRVTTRSRDRALAHVCAARALLLRLLVEAPIEGGRGVAMEALDTREPSLALVYADGSESTLVPVVRPKNVH